MRDSLNNRIPKTAMVIRATEVGGISGFRNCRRKWYFASHNGMNLEPALRAKKLSDGICWHAGLESYYRDGDFYKGFDEAFQNEVELMRLAISDGIYDEEIQEDLDSRKKLAYTIFEEEYKEWANTKAYPQDKDLEVVGTEVRLLIPLRNPAGNRTKGWIAVKLDGIVRTKEGVYYALEHKYQSKSTNVDNPTHLPLDIQMGVQVWALRQYLRYHDRTNPVVGGALYNLTRKQMPGSRVKNPICGRHIVRRSDRELDILMSTIYKDMVDMRRTQKHPAERTYNPQMLGICTWGCEFREVCEAMNRGEDVQFLLEAGFSPRQQDIWTMLKNEMNEMKGE